MSNKVRKCKPGITYHTMSRCIELKHLLAEEFAKKIAMRVLRQARKKYDFKYINYALMDNHFHFLIQTVEGGATISCIMQFIKARIAEGYNKAMNRTGPFWNERFTDVIVEDQENPVKYLLWVIWYIAYNPVKAGKCSDPRDYKYSSIMHYLVEDAKSAVKIIRHQYFEELGATFEERVKKFLFYEEAYRKRYAIMF